MTTVQEKCLRKCVFMPAKTKKRESCGQIEKDAQWKKNYTTEMECKDDQS